MKTTIFTTFDVPGVTLLAFSATFFLAAMQFTQLYLASIGWHKFASVSWNG